ncbi:hypothetical protein JNUCC42_03595 [Brevibacterium sp. JNUCC-42]|nr:hypothetical protein JNUCC42_03595 [Brevibacterium sp. JNUCC-42]
MNNKVLKWIIGLTLTVLVSTVAFMLIQPDDAFEQPDYLGDECMDVETGAMMKCEGERINIDEMSEEQMKDLMKETGIEIKKID